MPVFKGECAASVPLSGAGRVTSLVKTVFHRGIAYPLLLFFSLYRILSNSNLKETEYGFNSRAKG